MSEVRGTFRGETRRDAASLRAALLAVRAELRLAARSGGLPAQDSRPAHPARERPGAVQRPVR